MRVYRFKSLKDDHVTAFAVSPIGRHLPDHLAPWHFLEPVDVPDGPSNAELLQFLSVDGYFVIGAIADRNEHPRQKRRADLEWGKYNA